MEMCDAQHKRITAIVGEFGDVEYGERRSLFCKYLDANLQLPCEVTGIEDFNWEEFYVIGPGNQHEYARLKKTRPSYTDKYELVGIDMQLQSEWILSGPDEIAARVKRISDSKEFLLGLSELKATDKKSENYQLLHDFSVWLINY